MPKPPGGRFDAIIVGAGHNGLTAAAYLARGGLRTLVLERRDVVGGCAVTEEIDPVRVFVVNGAPAAADAKQLRVDLVLK